MRGQQHVNSLPSISIIIWVRWNVLFIPARSYGVMELFNYFFSLISRSHLTPRLKNNIINAKNYNYIIICFSGPRNQEKACLFPVLRGGRPFYLLDFHYVDSHYGFPFRHHLQSPRAPSPRAKDYKIPIIYNMHELTLNIDINSKFVVYDHIIDHIIIPHYNPKKATT